MLKFFKKNIVNLFLIGLIVYLAYQKFVVNRPEKNIDVTELSLVNEQKMPVSMASFSGKPLFVSFYSSWCAPCMVEMPSIYKLYQEMKDEDMNFLLVNTTSLQDIEKFEKQKGFDLPQYLLMSSGSIPVKTIPLTYIIDKKGDVIQVVNRPKNWNTNSVKKTLRQLIAQ